MAKEEERIGGSGGGGCGCGLVEHFRFFLLGNLESLLRLSLLLFECLELG